MIQRSIHLKLFFAIFLACGLAITAMALLSQQRFQQTFDAYLDERNQTRAQEFATALTTHYRATGSWQTLSNDENTWLGIAKNTSLARGWRTRNDKLTREERRNSKIIRLKRRLSNFALVALPDESLIRGELHTDRERLNPTYITDNDDQRVGYLVTYRSDPRRSNNFVSGLEKRLYENSTSDLWKVALLSLVAVSLIAFLFARQLVRPIRHMRKATARLADGHYDIHIKNTSQDELGQLSTDFNQLATRLQSNEQARKQWVMDIAHELRTPLAVLRGEIEALQDGISKADSETLGSLHHEALHLQHLINDLYELSITDNGALSYKKETVDIIDIIRNVLTIGQRALGYQQDEHLHIDLSQMMTEPVTLQGDPQRLQQLFTNLLKNSDRYTDKPGTLLVTTTLEQDAQTNTEPSTAQTMLKIVFQDSKPGVPDEALPKLFDRLYRVDASRNRARGGAGLGLSISHNIVSAHDGSIHAEHSSLGGLKVVMRFPVTMNER